MSDIIKVIPPVFIAMYGALVMLFLFEAVSITCKLLYMRKYRLAGQEPLLYSLFLGMAIASVLMAIRTALNIFICDSSLITILRIVSSSMVSYVIFMASRILWIFKVKAQYLICPKD